MNSVLIIIDYQYDFVEDDGLLTIGKPAKNIESNIQNAINEYIENQHDLIFTLDTHIKEEWNIHPESKSFKIHCEKGTKGHEIYGNIKDTLKTYRNIRMIEKMGYCPKIEDLENIVKNYDNIELCGVVTEVCVLQTAIALYNTAVNIPKKINFKVNKNACASFSKEGHINAINYMKNILGFEII